MAAKIAILVIYLVTLILIGVYCRKKTKSVSDFVLGGRSVGSWLAAFAFGTSYFSAVIFIGYAGQFGWSYGVSATWIGIGNALLGSMLAWLVMGNRTRCMTKHLNSSTMPEFFEKRYNSKTLKLSSAVIIFIFLIPYTASVYNGLSRIFEMAFNIPYEACIIAMALLTAVYVILGGYMATAISDFVQGIIMLVGIIAVIVCVIRYNGGMGESLDLLGKITDTKIPENSLNTIFGPDPINLFGVVILTSLGTWGLPQMVHKFYAIKDKSAVKKGTIISTLFAVVVAGGSYFFGGFGRLFTTADEITVNGKAAFDMIVPTMLQKSLPTALVGLIVVLVLSASMSTLSSLVLTSSSTVTLDLIKPACKKGLSEKKQVLIMRIFIFVFLLLSVAVALMKNTYITPLMSISWGALAGAFLGPFIWGLYSKKITTAACLTSFITGVGITVAHMCIFTLGGVKGTICGFNLASPINAGAFAMILSLVIVPVVSCFTKKQDKASVDEIFSCYNEK